MECKFCKAEIGEDVEVCPACGKNIQEEELATAQELPAEEAAEVPAEEIQEEPQEVDAEVAEEVQAEPEAEVVEQTPVKKRVWKTVAIAAGCLAALLIMVGALLYALGVDLGGKGDGVLYRENYTVSDEKGAKAADKVVATAGDRELTNAELQIHYWYGVENFLNYYGSYLAYMGFDQSAPLEDQIFDAQTGMTWQQYLLDAALTSWHRYAAMNLLAEDAGYQVDASIQANMDSTEEYLEQVAAMYGFESALDLIQSDWGAVCNVEGYLAYMEANTVGLAYYNSQYEKLMPTDAEVEAYFTQKQADFEKIGVTKDGGKYVDVRHILVCPQGGTTADDGTVTYSDEEWEACRASAQEILDQFLAGEATEESFAAMAMESSEDGGSASNGGLYTQVYQGRMVPEFNDWCFDEVRKYGDTALVKTTYGYHVMYFVDSYDIWYYNAKSELIKELTDKMLQDAMERWPMEVNYKNIVLSDMYGTSE